MAERYSQLNKPKKGERAEDNQRSLEREIDDNERAGKHFNLEEMKWNPNKKWHGTRSAILFDS